MISFSLASPQNERLSPTVSKNSAAKLTPGPKGNPRKNATPPVLTPPLIHFFRSLETLLWQLLSTPRVNLKTCGQRSSPFQAPKVWVWTPLHAQNCQSPSFFSFSGYIHRHRQAVRPLLTFEEVAKKTTTKEHHTVKGQLEVQLTRSR